MMSPDGGRRQIVVRGNSWRGAAGRGAYGRSVAVSRVKLRWRMVMSLREPPPEGRWSGELTGELRSNPGDEAVRRQNLSRFMKRSPGVPLLLRWTADTAAASSWAQMRWAAPLDPHPDRAEVSVSSEEQERWRPRPQRLSPSGVLLCSEKSSGSRQQGRTGPSPGLSLGSLEPISSFHSRAVCGPASAGQISGRGLTAMREGSYLSRLPRGQAAQVRRRQRADARVLR